jgi:hypothetical protein
MAATDGDAERKRKKLEKNSKIKSQKSKCKTQDLVLHFDF